MSKHITVNGHKAVVETGSKQNGGRKIAVYHTKVDGHWTTHSTNYARAEVEHRLNRNLSAKQHVDHKDNNHSNDSGGNLRVLSAHDNIAKEDMRRAGEKWHG